MGFKIPVDNKLSDAVYAFHLKYVPVYAKLLVAEKLIKLWLSNEWDEFITTTESRKRTKSEKDFAVCKKNGIIKKEWDIDIKKQLSGADTGKILTVFQ